MKKCCIFSHGKITYTKELEDKIYSTAERLITKEDVSTFLFGGRSKFDSLCLNVLTQLKNKYPHIQRIYVRSENPHTDNDYWEYILKSYDYSYFPPYLAENKRAKYIKQDFELINKCDFCLFHYERDSKISRIKIAFDYAKRTKKTVINIL